MVHEEQCRQIIDVLIKTERCEGNGAHHMEKVSKGCEYPFVHHNARKEEGGYNGLFFFRQFIGGRFPDAFQINVHPFIKVYKHLINVNVVFQILIEKAAADHARF